MEIYIYNYMAYNYIYGYILYEIMNFEKMVQVYNRNLLSLRISQKCLISYLMKTKSPDVSKSMLCIILYSLARPWTSLCKCVSQAFKTVIYFLNSQSNGQFCAKGL